jgi:isocitrate/isopropylmalate dehydrogenase
MTQTHRVAVIAGDGIGPEVTAEALKVLRAERDRGRHSALSQRPRSLRLSRTQVGQGR